MCSLKYMYVKKKLHNRMLAWALVFMILTNSPVKKAQRCA